MDSVRNHGQLRIYQIARVGAVMVFRLSIKFPPEEKFEATNQIRRTARSVAAGIAEAWRWRFYPAKFISKLIEVEGEAAETQTWLDIALDCGYIAAEEHAATHQHYESLLARLVNTRRAVRSWSALNGQRNAPKLQKP
jgi:four helix bundle protein